MKRLYCLDCGAIERPRTHTPGSIWIELVLWLFLILPGLCYSLWRLTSRRKVCRVCRRPNVIPETAPLARRAQEAGPLPFGRTTVRPWREGSK